MPAFVDGLCAEYGIGPVMTGPAIALATGGTIDDSWGYVRLNPAGNITGVILAPGNRNGQMIVLFNESGNTITFAAAATSHVADGATTAIPASTGRLLVWNSGDGLWHRMA